MKKPSLKRFKRRNKEEIPSRITNETVAEHRERILAGGRRFKYPIQYARHKLVANALIIILVSLVVLVILSWWQLYIAQNSSSFMYRLTRIFPLPVAQVDGEPVPFKDYLVQYRGSEHYLSKYDEIKVDSPDGKTQLMHIKRESLNRAEADAYAAKVARQRGISVTEKDVDAVISQQRDTVNGRITQETYDASSRMMYDWSPEDYRDAVKRSILRARVAFAVDEESANLQRKAAELIRTTNGDFEKVAAELAGPDQQKPRVRAAVSGLMYSTSTLDGLSISEVAKIPVGTVSGVLQSTTDDGYYFVKVLDKNDKQVNFAYVQIPLREFQGQFDQLKKTGKIKEFISVK